MQYSYDYPRPMVTVDMLILRGGDEGLELLLIKRAHNPFAGQWALPGGFIDMDEKLVESARRELREETGLSAVNLMQFHSAGDPGRDPRGRTVTLMFCGILPPPFPAVRAGDDARTARWHRADKLPELAFDHRELIKSGLDEIRFRALWRLWTLLFMPGQFLPAHLSTLCKQLLSSAEFAGKIIRVAESLSLIRRKGNEYLFESASRQKLFFLNSRQLQNAWFSASLGSD